MSRVFSALGVVVLGLVLVGCGPSEPKGPKMVAVKGTVSLDGKPMDSGEVIFTAPGNAAAASFEVKGGAFSGQAAIGDNKVAVMSYKQGEAVEMGGQKFGGEKVNFIPAQFNHQTTLSAKVADGGANEFKFEVTSQ
ncbi:MAG: hypothetical protein ACKO38_10780 [Planctomycetota bacterium]